MEIYKSDKIVITQEYGLGIHPINEVPEEERLHLMIGDLGLTIHIKNIPYTVLTSSQLIRANKYSDDGNYHFLYIQINTETGEYYIGKVNRKKWKEVERYQGSGLRFINKYNKHKDCFIRYHILACASAKESEVAEAEVVDKELLEDPLCLNLVCGGGGTTHHSAEERNEKIRRYMIEHPENYRGMVEKAKELYQSEEKSLSLINRNKAIKNTMSSPKYKEMTRERINNWKTNNPQAYAESRLNNKIAQQSELTKKKRNASLKKWRNENPETYNAYKRKLVRSQHSVEAEKKRSASLKEYNKAHPEVIQKRSKASAEKCRKAINMIDLETKEVIQRFDSIQSAAEWLVNQGIARNINCKASICDVCVKRSVPGHGTKKSAYGFGWEHAQTTK